MNEPSMGRSGSTMFVRARTERTFPPPIMRETLDAALAEIFGESAVPSVPGETPDEPVTTETPPTGDLTSLLAAIDRLLEEANTALRSGDLGGYQAKVDEATELVRSLVRSAEGSGN